MRFEAESGGVDLLECSICRFIAARRNGEAIDSIAVAGNSLKLVQVHAHLILAARYLCRISPPLDYRRDDDRVAIDGPGPGRYNELVTDGNARVLGEALVNCDSSIGGLLKEEQSSENMGEHALNLAGGAQR